MIERFGSVELVVVGSLNVDQVVYCERVPDEGETLVAEQYGQGFGGKGANQAVMAARLGARVAMIGCLGDDDLGDATIANLAAMAVDVDGHHSGLRGVERGRLDLGRCHGQQPHPDRPRRQRRPHRRSRHGRPRRPPAPRRRRPARDAAGGDGRRVRRRPAPPAR